MIQLLRYMTAIRCKSVTSHTSVLTPSSQLHILYSLLATIMNQALKSFQMTGKEYAYIINNKYLESVNEYIKMG